MVEDFGRRRCGDVALTNVVLFAYARRSAWRGKTNTVSSAMEGQRKAYCPDQQCDMI
jgi:hypothetical protein